MPHLPGRSGRLGSKGEVVAVPAAPISAPKQFIQGAPVLHVPSVKDTAAYYRDTLGFQWDFGGEEYSVVWRENSAIHLAKGDGLDEATNRPRLNLGPDHETDDLVQGCNPKE